jgi:tetratricopeptide (TPR) repeat protein
MNEPYHHGQVIKEYRIKRGMSQAALAELWPDHPVNIRYIQHVEAGASKITDQRTLRQLSKILDIPLWCFGLSAYNPFAPEMLPGHGEKMYNETLDIVEDLIQHTWYLRRAAPLVVTEKTVKRLDATFQYLTTYLSPAPRLEPRFLRLYAQTKLMQAVMHIERKQYGQALEACSDMYQIAQQLGEPAILALALTGMGTEYDRAGNYVEAVNRLEEARDASFGASRQIMAFVNAYLARAYASSGDIPRFQRAIDTAQNIATNLGQKYGDGTDLVFHKISGILAERSYGYLQINEPKKVLTMQDEIIKQIEAEHNVWLGAWIPLDWAQAYFMLNEIEASVNEGRAFFHRALALQSPHVISRAYEFLVTLEDAGYADVKAVRAFRNELNQARREQLVDQSVGDGVWQNDEDIIGTSSTKVLLPSEKYSASLKKEIDVLAKEMFTYMKTNETQTQGIAFMKATTEDIQEEFDMATSMFGDAVHSIATREAWLQKNPDTDFIVRDRGIIVGFINMLPVKPETIKRFMDGKMRGWEILADDVLPYTPNSTLECIVMGMATAPEAERTRRAQYGAKLISGLLDFLQTLAQQNIVITKFYATSVTPTGIAILRNAGFQDIGQIGKRIAFELDTMTSTSQLATAYRETLKRYTAHEENSTSSEK